MIVVLCTLFERKKMVLAWSYHPSFRGEPFILAIWCINWLMIYPSTKKKKFFVYCFYWYLVANTSLCTCHDVYQFIMPQMVYPKASLRHINPNPYPYVICKIKIKIYLMHLCFYFCAGALGLVSLPQAFRLVFNLL